ncbi:hypothetical protein F4X73_15180 [Candidatus Poribacteria bacterium]|nr:hypothetical protein [Candidatus Poribacteria bacterium]MYF56469.1 hypothetical protein [Candidatus Poribacteria bacterium]
MLSIRNKKLVLFAITLLCITTVVSAVTWKELYAALDAFLNAKGVWETVEGQIKSLEDETESLQAKIDQENEDEQSDNALILHNMYMSSVYEKKVEDIKEDLTEAKTDLEKKDSRLSSAISSYEFSKIYEKKAKKAYDNYVRMCDDPRYCQPDCYYCNEHQRLYKAWQDWKKEREDAKKERDAAFKEYVPAYNLVEAIEKWLNWNEQEHRKYRGLVKYWEKARDVHVEKSKKLQTKFDEKNAKLTERRTRKLELRAATPSVRIYMNNILAAWKLPDFDYDKYIEKNPPPEIIFAKE